MFRWISTLKSNLKPNPKLPSPALTLDGSLDTTVGDHAGLEASDIAGAEALGTEDSQAVSSSVGSVVEAGSRVTAGLKPMDSPPPSGKKHKRVVGFTIRNGSFNTNEGLVSSHQEVPKVQPVI